jgi:phosphonate transport system permease protein
MAEAIQRLAPDQLAPLARGYRDAMASKRRVTLIGLAVFIALVILSALVAQIDLVKFATNAYRFTDYIGRIFVLDTGDYTGQLVFLHPTEWMWGFIKWGKLLLETILIAYVGTLIGAIGGFFLCFLAAKNLVSTAWIRIATRRFLEFCRTVPELVFALIFVIAFGLGPMAGVLAIMIHTTGAMGKLFSEVVENIDMKPVEGVSATGASWTETVRYAVVPQVLSNFASYALLRFEINVRGAAVMGFVGAGGIGQDLIEAIRKFYYADVSAILVLIIATVMIIDLLTERLRHALIGYESKKN